jgi:hypothetical protein
MLADTAVLAYRNFLRIQGWIGSLCLVFERELFGQEPVSESNGATVGERMEREMHQLEQSLIPLLDRACWPGAWTGWRPATTVAIRRSSRSAVLCRLM